MGRPERPLDPADGPVAALAHDLRALREAAGRPTYAAMARKAHRSASVLAEAAGGTAFPTLDTTLAYVAACGGDPGEWTARWAAVKAEVDPAPVPAEAGPAPVPSEPPRSPLSTDPVEAQSSVAAGPPRHRRRVALGVAAAAALLLGAVAVVRFGAGDTPAAAVQPVAAASGTSSAAVSAAVPPPTEAAETLTVERPVDGGTVSMLDDVVIRRTGTAVGRHVWILVQFAGGPVTNPQGDCSTHDGVTYLCAKAQFGDPDTTAGTKFEIRAVEVDEEGHLAMDSLVDSGFNPALRPVPYFAESGAVTVSRT